MGMTLITGVPGSGKTLMAVAKFVKSIIGDIAYGTDDDGNTTEHPRVVFSNINRLALDHELIDGSDTGGLRNWHQWAKPGSYIVYDEVQKQWPMRPNGSKIPADIEALQTHRHMGVDFVLLTQDPPLVDRAVRSLVDRHIHVRRMAGMPFAFLYEWDGCSSTLRFTSALQKRMFWYPSWAYKLYKSAEVHTKQRRATPSAIWFVLVALVAMAVVWPTLFSKIYGRLSPAQASTAENLTVADLNTGKFAKPAHAASGPAGAPSPLPSPAAPAPVVAPVFAGCVVRKGQCQCYAQDGHRVDLNAQFCEERAPLDLSAYFNDLRPIAPAQTPDTVAAAADRSVLAAMAAARPAAAASALR